MTINFPPSFAKSWMTSLVGLLSAIYPVAQGFKAFQTGDWKTLLHDPLFYIAMLGTAQGFVSKDAQVTGGTSGQPSTPQALKDANQAPAKAPDAPAKA
jgi:hypothetical protein